MAFAMKGGGLFFNHSLRSTGGVEKCFYLFPGTLPPLYAYLLNCNNLPPFYSQILHMRIAQCIWCVYLLKFMFFSKLFEF